MTHIAIVGTLGRDPELRFSASGMAVANFSVAESHRKKNPNTGEWDDLPTTWWRCVAFGQLAENVCESFVKGDRVMVDGRSSTNEWTTPEGDKRSQIQLTADDVAGSAKWATVKVMRNERRGGEVLYKDRPVPVEPAGYEEEEPF